MSERSSQQQGRSGRVALAGGLAAAAVSNRPQLRRVRVPRLRRGSRQSPARRGSAARPSVAVRAAPASYGPRPAARPSVQRGPSLQAAPVMRAPRAAPRRASPPAPRSRGLVSSPGRGRGLSPEQAIAHSERLGRQHRDLARRGKGSKAQRRIVALAAASGHVRGLSKRDKVVSKAQQRWAFAHSMPWASSAAKSGAPYRALPTRVRPRAK